MENVVQGPSVERLDHPLGEGTGDVVGDDELAGDGHEAIRIPCSASALDCSDVSSSS